MRCTIPEKMPIRKEYIEKFVNAIFPDLEALGQNNTPYGYSCACDGLMCKLGYRWRPEEVGILSEDSDLFRLMFDLDQNYHWIFGTTFGMLEDRKYADQKDGLLPSLKTFCDNYSTSFNNWFKTPVGRLNDPFRVALCLSFMLLIREECVETRRTFFLDCLETLGVTEIEEAVLNKIFDFSWDVSPEITSTNHFRLNRLVSKPTIMLATAAMVIAVLLSSYDPETNSREITEFQNLFKAWFAEEIKAQAGLETAQQNLYSFIKYFEPRSIQVPNNLLPENCFVVPHFSREGKESGSPLACISDAAKSKRSLIVAKTGLGKSAFLQTASMCMLSRYGTASPGLEKLGQDLGVPQDMYIISVPAPMFTFCYTHNMGKYRAWTTDFVSLFFNTMWSFYPDTNFFSKQGLSDPDLVRENAPSEFAVDEALLEYLQTLAKQGRLLLLLDSFDEIPGGEMRTAYLKALAGFHDKYCALPENGQVGAHVVISSREMAPETMREIHRALNLRDNDVYGILPLNGEQRKELVEKWVAIRNIDAEITNELLELIETNHYYLDYATNPYMLSVICAHPGHDSTTIAQRFITTLIDRMLGNYLYSDYVISNVLTNVERILQDIAGETLTTGNPHFTRQKLARELREEIDTTDLTEKEIERYIDRLHEIFVTAVGLIVPADGADNDYQFINNQIRFELAARGIQRNLAREERAVFYRSSLLPAIKDVDDYVGLLVPLLCQIKLEDFPLAEMLISDLAMYDFQSDGEDKILVRAMVDLLLSRYGSSIINALSPGRKDVRYARRAQRILLLRLLASPNFCPTDKEKAAIAALPVYQENRAWLRDCLTETLN